MPNPIVCGEASLRVMRIQVLLILMIRSLQREFAQLSVAELEHRMNETELAPNMILMELNARG